MKKDEWPFKFEFIDAAALFVDDRYQRPVSAIADRIAEHFNPYLFEPLLVSDRSEPLLVSDRGQGRYAIADGQNRWEGARRVGRQMLPCRVVKLQPAEEALLFAALQAERKRISPLEAFRAEVFGGDKEAVAVSRILKRKNIHAHTPSGAYQDADSLAAIGTARAIYRRHGEEHLSLVLDTIKAAWPDDRQRFYGEVLGATSTFVAKEGENLHQMRLVVALGEQIGSVKELTARSAAKRRGGTGLGGGSFVYTRRVIEDAYKAVGRGAFRKQWQDVTP